MVGCISRAPAQPAPKAPHEYNYDYAQADAATAAVADDESDGDGAFEWVFSAEQGRNVRRRKPPVAVAAAKGTVAAAAVVQHSTAASDAQDRNAKHVSQLPVPPKFVIEPERRELGAVSGAAVVKMIVAAVRHAAEWAAWTAYNEALQSSGDAVRASEAARAQYAGMDHEADFATVMRNITAESLACNALAKV